MYSRCSDPVKIRFKALRYNYEFDLKDAERLVHSKSCLNCPVQTASKLFFWSHLCRDGFECKMCHNVLKSKRSLQVHLKRHNKSLVKDLISKTTGGFKCKPCDKVYFTRYNCTLHVMQEHVSVPKDEWLQCEICEFKAVHKRQMTKHSKSHREDNLKCGFCDYICFKTSHLKEHVVRKHTKDQDIKWYKCNFCDYKGKLEYYLKNHQRAKHETKMFKCASCEKSFIGLSKLNHHVKLRHTSAEHQNWHQCQYCDFKTLYKIHVQRHIANKHSKGTGLTCEFCRYETSSDSDLQHHISIKHMFKCDYCEKIYKQRNRYNRHMKTSH